MRFIRLQHLGLLCLICAASVWATQASRPANAQESTRNRAGPDAEHDAARPRIVLVHGAFADGSGWRRLIPLLEDAGYFVTAVQNPLTSLADDVATTRRVIEAEAAHGPVVVVGHSYGGAVITGAAAGNADVKALVYVNAFAPDAGELLGEMLHIQGPAPLDDALVPDSAGFLSIDRARFHALFCADVSEREARIMAATQGPIASSVFGQALDAAAWKQIPSWYVLGRDDQTIPPSLQRFMAERMGATIIELDTSHVSFISKPRAVLRAIEEAVAATRE